MKDQLLTYPDLALEHFGGKVVYATDDTYGKKENLNKEGDPSKNAYRSDKSDFDGWIPSFKKNNKEWVVIRLGCEANIIGFEIDTSNLSLDQPVQISIDAIHFNSIVEDWQLADFLNWDVVLEKTNLKPNHKNYFKCNTTKSYTHVRLHLQADGGISRCRVFSNAYKDWNKLKEHEHIDLALITHGGKILDHSATHAGSAQNLIAPKKSTSADDGWLTKYDSNTDGFHWVIVKLGHKGFIEKVVIDTYNFYENRAQSCSLEYCIASTDQKVLANKVTWHSLLEKKGLKPHRENPFSGKDIRDHEAIMYIRLKIYPSGGLSRLRLIGSIKK